MGDSESESTPCSSECDDDSVDNMESGNPCPYCARLFKKPSKLKDHIRSHTGEKPYGCSFVGCGKRFTRPHHLKRHMLTHTGERPFACAYDGCSQTFNVSTHLTRHMKVHIAEKPYACEEPGCAEAFSKQNQLKRHMCSHTQLLPYPCTHDGCTEGFNFPSALKRHLDRHHLGKKENTYVCGYEDCGHSFENYAILRKHVKDKHGQSVDRFKCPECGKAGFRDKRDMNKHYAVHFPETRKLFPCDIDSCTKSFTSLSNLYTHQRSVHSDEREHVCMYKILSGEGNPVVECGKSFKLKYMLDRHLKTHQKEVLLLSPTKKQKKIQIHN